MCHMLLSLVIDLLWLSKLTVSITGQLNRVDKLLTIVCFFHIIKGGQKVMLLVPIQVGGNQKYTH